MPRPKKPGSAEPKTRSRNGCWPCKNRKIKCGEEKPGCINCQRNAEICDYSVRLNWEGRTKRKGASDDNATFQLVQHSPEPTIKKGAQRPSQSPNIRQRPSNGSPMNVGLAGALMNGNGQARTIKATQNPTMDDIGPLTTLEPAFRDLLSNSQLSRLRDPATAMATYPSPADSSIESPPLFTASQAPMPGLYQSPSNPEMPPPFQNPPCTSMAPGSWAGITRENGTLNNGAKRKRLSPPMESQDLFSNYQPFQPRSFNTGGNLTAGNTQRTPQLFRNHSSSPSVSNVRMPPTPAASSVGSEDQYGCKNQSIGSTTDVPDSKRRISIQSMLSESSPVDPCGEETLPGRLDFGSFRPWEKTDYGTDHGYPDLDIPKNDDLAALSRGTPGPGTIDLNGLDGIDGEDIYTEFGFGLNATNDCQEQAPYYAKPVRVTISKSLEPLPALLRDNPMNLLYFHHFLNHTARILVPHDCSENPFKRLLPRMAVQDDNLLHLLLAYSASHRSRLLNHPEPVNRIALYVKDVFSSLGEALADPTRQISNSNLATAIMLASLEIVSPRTFEVDIPWQTHLNMARRIISARGGANSVARDDQVSYFLTRWFAYLDVLGSLCGGKNDQPLFHGNYWANSSIDDRQEYQIDCLLGFTSHCVSILARIGELARSCDGQRINSAGNIIPGWRPPARTVQAAEELKTDLMKARMRRYQGCPHRRPSTQVDVTSYAVELETTNDAFHWAGLIHLDRRVLGKPSSDFEVQFAVGEIVRALSRMRKGGTAEACLLFPMFTAGCDAVEPEQRNVIMERLKSVEGSGMTQVRKARMLIEKVWETGRPWETLVTGEFLG